MPKQKGKIALTIPEYFETVDGKRMINAIKEYRPIIMIFVSKGGFVNEVIYNEYKNLDQRIEESFPAEPGPEPMKPIQKAEVVEASQAPNEEIPIEETPIYEKPKPVEPPRVEPLPVKPPPKPEPPPKPTPPKSDRVAAGPGLEVECRTKEGKTFAGKIVKILNEDLPNEEILVVDMIGNNHIVKPSDTVVV